MDDLLKAFELEHVTMLSSKSPCATQSKRFRTSVQASSPPEAAGLVEFSLLCARTAPCAHLCQVLTMPRLARWCPPLDCILQVLSFKTHNT